MFPHRSLILEILRLPFFSIELNSLSRTEVLKKATEELPELRTGGGFNLTGFYCTYMVTLFLLETGIFFRFVCFVFLF